MPDAGGARPLADDEPALILIAGDLYARHAPAFMKNVPGAVAHAFGHPGYLGGGRLKRSSRRGSPSR